MTFPSEWTVIKFHGSSHHQPVMDDDQIGLGQSMWIWPQKKMGWPDDPNTEMMNIFTDDRKNVQYIYIPSGNLT